MDEDKRYLLIPYGLLIGLLIRMYAQKDFSGFPLFIAIMTAAICILATWLVFRPQDKKTEQPASPKPEPESAKPTEAPKPAPALKSIEIPQPAPPKPVAPAKPAPVKEVPAVSKPVPHRSLNLLYYTLRGGKLIPAELTGSQEATLRRKTLESVTALDVSCIDTTGVTGMASVFARCYCLEKLDLSTFDFSQVTDMGKIFDECGALREVIFSDTINRTCCIPRYTSSRSTDELNEIWRQEYIARGPQLADITVDHMMDKQLVSFQEATHAEQCAYLGLLKSAKITVVPHRQPAPLPDPADDDPGFLIKDDVLVYYYGKEPEVCVPKGVKYIGEKAFASRPKPEVLEAIPPRYRAQFDEAVLNQIAPLDKGQAPGNPYIRQVILPEGVIYIRTRAFYMCAQLEKVELPESLEWIGSSAFCHCAKLTDINLPQGVRLDMDPFDGSPGVYQTVREWEWAKNASKPKPAPRPRPYADVDVPEGGLTLQNSDFDIKDGVLLRYKGRGKQVVVPQGVHTIAKHAFVWSNTRTSTISVPPMFWDQYGADSFTGQAEVTTTNHTGMSHVSSVTLPEGVVLIQDAAFYKCSGLKEINFPQSLQYIGRRAFCQCVQLPAIDLPPNVRVRLASFEDCRDEIIHAVYDHIKRAKEQE